MSQKTLWKSSSVSPEMPYFFTEAFEINSADHYRLLLTSVPQWCSSHACQSETEILSFRTQHYQKNAFTA